ncbi:Omp28-related outer membrane protein [Flavobacterium silvaticum]|uniref:Omp28-related outer membrane protein n=1 Tax=Flavobacterium silvaticum TaxID=1852020 RepID=A0A972FM86_9FLAO|nr:Omp28-related outer membrane protein [Flavobacterium silvaticum]NMH28606.1 Omp28-related outer membrane protein [Flavobacterium silvaticum]
MKKLQFIFLFVATAFLASCSKDYEALPSVGEIRLNADETVKLIGETVTISVVDDLGDDVTDEAEITINGEPFSGTTFSSATTGTFSFKATYAGLVTNQQDITFRDPSQIVYKRNILIEDYTGTWCGYCPRVAWGIEKLAEQTQNFVAVGIHRASSVPTDAAYDPYNFDTTELENMVNIPGYPKGMVNRTFLWPFPEPNKINQVLDQGLGDPKLGLSLTSTADANSYNLTVNARFAQQFSNLKLVVYVVENGLVHDQHNYTTYYNDVDPIPNFVHNHVLRSILTAQLGDAIADSEANQSHEFARTFSLPFPSNVENKAEVEFVAFIVGADNSVINAQKAHVGTTKDYEEL